MMLPQCTLHRVPLPPNFLIPSWRLLLPPQQQRTIRSICPPKPNRYNELPHLPRLGSTAPAALDRKGRHIPHRTGLLAIKKGMTAVFDTTTGQRTPCTIVQLDRVQVVGHKTVPQHGYWAVQIGHGWRRPQNISRPMLGYYAGQKVSPKKDLAEFRVKDEDGLVGVGQELGASWFVEGQFVDVKADCKGKGFAGVCYFLFSSFLVHLPTTTTTALAAAATDCYSIAKTNVK